MHNPLQPIFKLVCLVSLALMAVSCATESSSKRTPPPEKVPISSILVLPVTSKNQNLGDDAALTEKLIYQELSDQGYQVILPDLQTFKRLYDAALIESGSIYNPKTKSFLPLDRSIYMRYMIDNLKRYYDHDVLIDPEILLRPAKVIGDDAVWDSFKAEVEVKNAPKSGYRIPPMAKGISLRLASYTRNGAGIELTFVGVALPYYVYFNDGEADLELKKTFFTKKEIKDAVERALQPLLERVKVADE